MLLEQRRRVAQPFTGVGCGRSGGHRPRAAASAQLLWWHVCLCVLCAAWSGAPGTQHVARTVLASPATAAAAASSGSNRVRVAGRRGPRAAACNDEDDLLFLASAILGYKNMQRCSVMSPVLCATVLGSLCPRHCGICDATTRTM